LLKRIALWTMPILVIGTLFYWPMANVLGRGLRGSWVTVLSEGTVASAIWFTVWQAGASVLLCLLIGLPTAYVLYRRQVWAGRFLRALITVPFALPTIVTAIGFTVFQKQNVQHPGSGIGTWITSPIFGSWQHTCS